jgi:pimeloyl-ACP methyl ester carboxylesterase
MGGPRAALFSSVSAAVGTANAITALNTADAAGLLSSPKDRAPVFPVPSTGNNFDISALTAGALAAGRATLYTGRIALPYYQTVSDGSDLTAPVASTAVPALAGQWRGDDRLGAAPTAGGLGLPVPLDSDGTVNTTYRFPFAKPTTSVRVPLQVTLPNPTHQPAGFPATCGAVAAGSGGYPVVIYVHGITSDRSSVLALAHTLADKSCTATVAIDLPMHGIAPNNQLWHYLNVDRADLSTVSAYNSTADERHFEIAQNAAGQATAMNFSSTADGSGSWFINLSTLANSRDNLRQAVMDLLNLNASLATIDANRDGTPDFNTSKVSVVGVSLGGMIATTFVTVNQSVRANEALANSSISTATGGAVPTAFPVRLNNINGLVASVAGGQLTRILENSRSFGPKILGGLHSAGAVPGTSNYEKFMYVAQTMVDSGDPLNFAPTLRALGVPVLVQEIVGGANLGDGAYPADQVVPNNADAPVTHNYVALVGGAPAAQTYTTDTSPLAGTDSLISLLGISTAGTTPSAVNMSTVRGAASRLTIGYHGSLLTSGAGGPPTAGNLLATGEMQTQVVSFIANPTQTAFGTAGSNAAAPFTSVLTR